MRDSILGLIIGVGIGSILSLPLVIWQDGIFDFLGYVIVAVKGEA